MAQPGYQRQLSTRDRAQRLWLFPFVFSCHEKGQFISRCYVFLKTRPFGLFEGSHPAIVNCHYKNDRLLAVCYVAYARRSSFVRVLALSSAS